MNEIYKEITRDYKWKSIKDQERFTCYECSSSYIVENTLSSNHQQTASVYASIIQVYKGLTNFIVQKTTFLTHKTFKTFALLLSLVGISFFMFGFEYESDSLELSNSLMANVEKQGVKDPSVNMLLLDSLMNELESDVLALAEPHEEKAKVKSTKKIALIGFYDESIYPSNDLYELWDTSILYPYAEQIRKQDTEIKLIVQDKDNYCNFVPPIEGMVTSNYGPRGNRNHYGIDIELNISDPVYASFDGMVRIAKSHHSYGNVVIIRHYNGFETVYAHLDKLNVEPGDIVNSGEIIGLGGNTGRSTGPHLHYEIRFKGVPLNPNHIISFENNCLVSDSIKVVRVKNSYVAVPMGVPFHSVKKGEYLFYIARKYGTTVSHLCKINGIHRNKPLQIGQKLRIG